MFPNAVTTMPKSTGYRYLDQANAGNQIWNLKKQYNRGETDFHNSSVAKKLRENAARFRLENNLPEDKVGSGVNSKGVLDYYNGLSELAGIKSSYETNHAQNPAYQESEEARQKRERANEIRKKLGLSDAEYGSGVSASDVRKKADAVKQIYDIKNQYENYYQNSSEAEALRSQANAIRKANGLSDSEYGSGVSGQEVSENLGALYRSPEYQRDVSYKKFQDNNEQLYREMAQIYNEPDTMRPTLSREEAQKQAEGLIGQQLDKEIRDSLAYEDELAAQRGSYGQMSYGKRKALKEGQLQDRKANRLLSLVDSLIEEDRQKALQEYQLNRDNREKRVQALRTLLGLNQTNFNLGEQYRNTLQQEEATKQQAIYQQSEAEYKALKEQYDRAFEMSNSLGYITPELAEFAGVEAGTPMFKMVEYYGGLEKFYTQLDQEARFKAQDLAIAEYNAESYRIEATNPRYGYGGYNGSQYNNNAGSLTWNQAKAIWENFSSDFSKRNNNTPPNATDTIRFIQGSGFSDADKTALAYAAGLTPNQIANAQNTVMNADNQLEMIENIKSLTPSPYYDFTLTPEQNQEKKQIISDVNSRKDWIGSDYVPDTPKVPQQQSAISFDNYDDSQLLKSKVLESKFPGGLNQ